MTTETVVSHELLSLTYRHYLPLWGDFGTILDSSFEPSADIAKFYEVRRGHIVELRERVDVLVSGISPIGLYPTKFTCIDERKETVVKAWKWNGKKWTVASEEKLE